jgi:hypothetical protein
MTAVDAVSPLRVQAVAMPVSPHPVWMAAVMAASPDSSLEMQP